MKQRGNFEAKLARALDDSAFRESVAGNIFEMSAVTLLAQTSHPRQARILKDLAARFREEADAHRVACATITAAAERLAIVLDGTWTLRQDRASCCAAEWAADVRGRELPPLWGAIGPQWGDCGTKTVYRGVLAGSV